MEFISNLFYNKNLDYIKKTTNYDPSGIYIAIIRKDCSTKYLKDLFTRFAIPKGFKVSYPTHNTIYSIQIQSERQCTIKFGYNVKQQKMLMANFKNQDGSFSNYFQSMMIELSQFLCENNCLFGQTEKIREIDIPLEVKDILYYNEEILADTFHFANRDFYIAYVSSTVEREKIVDMLELLCKNNFFIMKFLGDMFDVYDQMMKKKCTISIGFNKKKERMLHISCQCKNQIWFKQFLINLSVMLFTHQFLRCQQFLVENKKPVKKIYVREDDPIDDFVFSPERKLTRTFSFGSLSVSSFTEEQIKEKLSLSNELVFKRNEDYSDEEASEDELETF